MTEEERIIIKKPEGHHCFACGTANPIGLKLEFYHSGDSICSEITLGRYHVGWENISHGGIISTLLDEVMSWTILYFKRVFFVTRKMEVKYVRPVLIGVPLTIRGKLVDSAESTNKIKAKAELRYDRGNLLARSTGEFVALTKEELSTMPDRSKEEMFSMIEKLPPL